MSLRYFTIFGGKFYVFATLKVSSIVMPLYLEPSTSWIYRVYEGVKKELYNADETIRKEIEIQKS